MRVFIIISFLIALFLISNSIWAQERDGKVICNKHIHGKVIDGESLKPIEGAVIFIVKEQKSTQSNIKGKFQIENICEENVTISCKYVGYKALSTSVNAKENNDIILTLHSDTCELESVIIVADRKQTAVMQEYQLKGVELDRTRGLSLGQTLQNIPGVFTIQTGPSIFKPVIQGVYGQRVLILNNGVRQEGQQWGSEHAPEIDPFVASKITVIKGAQSVRYGSDAIGGVILVEVPELKKGGGADAEVNLVGFSNNRQGVISGIINYSLKKIPALGFRVQGTIKQAGNTRTPNYWLQNTGFEEHNFSWATGYQKPKAGFTLFYSQFNTRLGVFRGSHFGDTADLAAAMRRTIPNTPSEFDYEIGRPYQEVMHELAKLKGYWRVSLNSKIEIEVARQFNYRAEFDTDRPYNNSLRGLPEMKFGLTTHTATIALSHQLHPHIKGSVGIAGIRQGNTARSTVGSFFIPNFHSYAGGIFLIETFRKNNWEVEAGLRYDYKWMRSYLFQKVAGTLATYELTTPELNFQNPSTSLGVGLQANSFLKLKSNFSTAFRPPTVNELYSNGVHHGVNTFEIGDANLRKEVAYSSNIYAQVQLPKIIAEVMIYHNYIQDYIFLQPQAGIYVVSIRGATPLFAYKQVDASFTGIDASLSDSLFRHVVYSGKLSLLRAYNYSAKEGLILTPPARINNALTFHTQSWSKIKHPFLTLSHTLVPRKRFVPANADFKAPPSGYGLWNLDTGFETHVAKQKIQFTFSINNILNTVYRDYLDRFRYFNDAVGINFVCRLKFLLA